MSKNYEEWLKYYENVTKEQVIFDLWLNMQEIEKLNNIINKAIKYCNNSRVTLKSQYFINVVKLLKGEKIDK